MKRILSAILVFCLLLALAGCAPKEYTLVEEKIIDTYDFHCGLTEVAEIAELYNNILRRANNTRRAADIVTKQYPLSLMQECASRVSRIGFNFSSCFPSTLLDAWYTVEAIRKVDDTYYYVAYKIKEGGWLYLFLEVDPYTHEAYPDIVHDAAAITHSIYIKDKANKKALAAIGEGSSFADVCAADPTAALAREYEINRCYTYVAAKQKHSLHWVDNEVFVFTYDETGETVTGTEHYPDGRVPHEGSDFVFDYNLLPIDCK